MDKAMRPCLGDAVDDVRRLAADVLLVGANSAATPNPVRSSGCAVAVWRSLRELDALAASSASLLPLLEGLLQYVSLHELVPAAPSPLEQMKAALQCLSPLCFNASPSVRQCALRTTVAVVRTYLAKCVPLPIQATSPLAQRHTLQVLLHFGAQQLVVEAEEVTRSHAHELVQFLLHPSTVAPDAAASVCTGWIDHIVSLGSVADGETVDALAMLGSLHSPLFAERRVAGVGEAITHHRVQASAKMRIRATQACAAVVQHWTKPDILVRRITPAAVTCSPHLTCCVDLCGGCASTAPEV